MSQKRRSEATDEAIAKQAKQDQPLDNGKKHISRIALSVLSEETNLRLEEAFLACQDSYSSLRKGMDEVLLPSTKNWSQIDRSIATDLNADIASIVGSSNGNTISSTATEDKRRPKRKVALLLSYSGTGYSGMQVNRNVPSIELDLLKALVMAGAVSTDNAMDPHKIGFQRCARTDKGVHAAGQVASMKLMVDDEGVVEKINKHLPPQIRVWGYSLVPKSFNSKTLCDSRIYEYLFPTYVLSEANAGVYAANAESKSDAAAASVGNDAFRIEVEALERLQSIFSEYKGTHNFHNFTVGKPFTDKSVKRYILDMQLSQPKILNGSEWLSVKIHGQSFMLHQIRKMIGLAILMIRTRTPASLVTKTFGKTRLNIPKAPALGLLLERPLFNQYNSTADKAGAATVHRERVDFAKYDAQANAFKEEWIYSALVKEESDQNVFSAWNRLVDGFAPEFGWFLNADGSIDESRRPSRDIEPHSE